MLEDDTKFLKSLFLSLQKRGHDILFACLFFFSGGCEQLGVHL